MCVWGGEGNFYKGRVKRAEVCSVGCRATLPQERIQIYSGPFLGEIRVPTHNYLPLSDFYTSKFLIKVSILHSRNEVLYISLIQSTI